jgi:hypothetical protein
LLPLPLIDTAARALPIGSNVDLAPWMLLICHNPRSIDPSVLRLLASVLPDDSAKAIAGGHVLRCGVAARAGPQRLDLRGAHHVALAADLAAERLELVDDVPGALGLERQVQVVARPVSGDAAPADEPHEPGVAGPLCDAVEQRDTCRSPAARRHEVQGVAREVVGVRRAADSPVLLNRPEARRDAHAAEQPVDVRQARAGRRGQAARRAAQRGSGGGRDHRGGDIVEALSDVPDAERSQPALDRAQGALDAALDRVGQGAR